MNSKKFKGSLLHTAVVLVCAVLAAVFIIIAANAVFSGSEDRENSSAPESTAILEERAKTESEANG